MSTVTSSSPTPAPAHPPSQVIVLAAAAGVSRATRALFDVVRGLETAGISTEVVLLRHGARLEELRALCPVKVVDDLTRSPVDRLLRLVRLGLVGGAIKGRVVRRWLRASRRPNTVVVVCGLAAARLVRQVPDGASIVVEVEPGEGPASVPDAVWAEVRDRAQRFVAPDEATRDLLVDAGVPAERVAVSPSTLDAGVGPASGAPAPSAPAPTAPTRAFLVALDAERGSDSYLLLSLLGSLRDAGIDTEVLLWRHGPLLDEMRSLCRVRVVDDLTRSPVDRLLRMVGLSMIANRVTGARLRRWLWQATRRYPSLWVRGLPAARIVRSTPLDARVVVQLADGEAVGPDRLGERDWEFVRDRVSGFLVPTDAERDALADAGVARDRVRVQAELGPLRASFAEGSAAAVAPVAPPPIDDETRRRRRGEIGVPDDAILIGSTGTHDWWKAPEPVVAFAWALRRRLGDREVHFVWLCHDLDDADGLWPLFHDIENAGLSEVFHVVEADALFSQLGLCDLLVLAGRPDAFAMIRAQVAMWARPVVCYRNGVTEVALGGGALPVDYLDVEGLADAVADIVDAPERLDELVGHAERVRLDAFDADQPLWLAAVTSLDEAIWLGGAREGRPLDSLATLFVEPGR